MKKSISNSNFSSLSNTTNCDRKKIILSHIPNEQEPEKQWSQIILKRIIFVIILCVYFRILLISTEISTYFVLSFILRTTIIGVAYKYLWEYRSELTTYCDQ